MVFESDLKKQRSRLHIGPFLHFENFQNQKKRDVNKVLDSGVVSAFFGWFWGNPKMVKKVKKLD